MADWARYRTQVRPWLANVTLVAVAGCVAATLAGFVGSWWWLLDLCAHFRVQYLFALSGCAVTLLAMRRWRPLTVAGVSIVVNAAVVLPLYCSTPAAADKTAVPLKVVAFNVNHANQDHEKLARYLDQARADVMVILEATPPLVKYLAARFPTYDSVSEARPDAFGIAVFSRAPLVTKRVQNYGPSALPTVEASFVHDNKTYSVFAVHTPPPISSTNSAERDALLATAARWAKQQAGHAFIIGDFNATPWSHAFRRLIDDSDFVNSQRGFGIHASWPRSLWPLSIPIDHCVHSPTLTTVKRSVGPFIGSDHRPLTVTLAPRAP